MASHKGLLIFASGLIGLLLVFRAHFSLYIAKGESMLPGLRSGDLVLVDKLAYRAENPKRGDIVVARERDDLIGLWVSQVKRWNCAWETFTSTDVRSPKNMPSSRGG